MKIEEWQFALLLVLLVIILFLIIFQSSDALRRTLGMKSENYRNYASSYSSGATQRFMTENTEPVLGKQFYPYNFEINAEKELLGKQVSHYENLTSEMEAPVFNTGDIISPPLISNEAALADQMRQTMAAESGTRPMDKGDSTAEFLMNYGY
jgi:hypothetical protein